MTKKYEVQAKFGKTWAIIETKTIFADALHYTKEHVGENYKMRIVRIVKTVIFEDK